MDYPDRTHGPVCTAETHQRRMTMVLKAPLTWAQTTDKLMTATEETCKKLLDDEVKGPNRRRWVERIFGKYSMLRTQRERTEILKSCKD